MSEPIRVKVDVTNPGQFFASCGLLELASRITEEGVEGWFEHDGFYLHGSLPVTSMMKTLSDISPTLMEEPAPGVRVERSIAPLKLPLTESTSLTLDAWTKWGIEKRKPQISADSAWKFWSGNQGVLKIWNNLRGQLSQQVADGAFDKSEALFPRVFMSGRFGFDAQAAWNALDAGYSPNDQNQPVATRPALELLALIGLQRFKPAVLKDFQFEYCTWGKPLESASAQVAACGLLAVPPSSRFRTKVVRRGKYGGLSYATKLSLGDRK